MGFQLLNNMGFEGEGRIIVGKVRHLHLRKSIVISMKPLRIDMEKLAQKPQNFQNWTPCMNQSNSSD